MVKTVLKMYHKGEWRVTFDDSASNNPYRVYYIVNGHRKLIERYGDLASCLHCITQQLTGHEWRMTSEKVNRLF